MSDDTLDKNEVDDTSEASGPFARDVHPMPNEVSLALICVDNALEAGNATWIEKTLAAEVRRLREERSEWMLQLKNLQSGLAGDGHVEAAKRLDQWIRTDPDEASVLTDEIQRLRELGYAHIDRAERIEADRDQLSASNLRLVAEREQLKADVDEEKREHRATLERLGRVRAALDE